MVGHPKLDWALASFVHKKPLIRINADTRNELYEVSDLVGIAGNGLFVFTFTAED